MSKARFLSNRTIAGLAVGLLACLSLTTALATRIHFSASTGNAPTATLEIKPTSIGATAEAVFPTTLTLASDQAVAWESVSLTVSYSSDFLSFSGLTLNPGWRIVSSQARAGELSFSLLDDSNDTHERLDIGTIIWRARAEGSGKISVTQGQVSFPLLGQSDTTQIGLTDKTVTVKLAEAYRNREENVQSLTEISPVVSQQLLIAPSVALFAFTSQTANKVAISYGETSALGAQISSTVARRDQLLKLDGLKPQTTYYYQISSSQEEQSSQILSQIKSFTTPAVGSGEPVFWQVLVSPSQPTNYATIYLLGLDGEGQAITGLEPKIELASDKKGVETRDFQDKNGYYQAAITSNGIWQEVVAVVSHLGQAKARLAFEPASDQSSTTSITTNSQSASVSTLQVALAGGILCLVGLLLLFRYFARLK